MPAGKGKGSKSTPTEKSARKKTATKEGRKMKKEQKRQQKES